MLDDLPRGHQEAAEEIRAHLVAIRGGAPFLAPTDARLLVDWLDQGRSVADILRAIERAAEARRKRRSRVPLALVHAKRHLGKPTAGDLAQAPPVEDRPHPLSPVAEALEQRAADEPRGLELKMLAAELVSLPDEDPEALLRGALAAVRGWLDREWQALGPARDERLAAARATLAEEQPDLDEGRREALAEERARDALRRSHPHLSAATLWDLVQR